MLVDQLGYVAEPDLIRALWLHAIPLDCLEGRKLFRQGDDPAGVFVLYSGDATMILEDDGGVQVARVPMPPGSILGLPALVSDKPYSMSAVAMKGATVGFVNRNDFSSLMLTEPLLALMIVQVLAAEVRDTRVALSECQAFKRRGRALRRKRPMPRIRARLRAE
jgi:CRP-like cAMP-binding protein